MSFYLCYDIRGIQSFIFKIPKLKYIIGGSALIDCFSRQTMKNLSVPDTEYIMSAAGKGQFWCKTETAAETLQKKIISEAQEIGVDIRFGLNENFSRALKTTDQSIPFVPKSLDGEPCSVSGLYPVGEKEKEHSVVNKRLFTKDGPMYRWFENQLISNIRLDPGNTIPLEFFHDATDKNALVSENNNTEEKVLGESNRWAIICMDGNDIGRQFYEKQKVHLDPNEMVEWIKQMSESLNYCTKEAVSAGIQQVIHEWFSPDKFRTVAQSPILLPIRPIIVGGDDIVVICHTQYAASFVKEVIRVFNTTSKEIKPNPWFATKGELTISAGILYCTNTLPLHAAISYAQSLLINAKQKGRQCSLKEPNNAPSPATIDWEQITDSVIDTPQARRYREFIFFDKDIDETIELTQRPCTLEKYTEIEALAEHYEKAIPTSIRHKILRSLRAGYSDRLAFVAEIKKNYPQLASNLDEYGDPKNWDSRTRWKSNSLSNNTKSRSTDVIDAFLLLEEKKRTENGEIQWLQ